MKNIKLIDNRGFVIVETIIVAVFIIGICTFLFANFVPLIGDYERISKYDDLDSKYKTHEIRKMVLRDIEKNPDSKKVFTDAVNNIRKYQIYSNSGTKDSPAYQFCDKLTSKKYCNKLLGSLFLDVKEIIVSSFKLSSLKYEIKSNVQASRALKEYIEYLPSYSNYSSEYDDYYRIIVVFNNGHMANIEVNYEGL